MPRERWFQAAAFAFLIFAALFSLTPIYWLIATAFKSPEEAMRYPPTLIPTNPSLQNFIYRCFQKGICDHGFEEQHISVYSIHIFNANDFIDNSILIQ